MKNLELQESTGSHRQQPHSSDDDDDDDDDDDGDVDLVDEDGNNDDDDDDDEDIGIARIKWFSSAPPTQCKESFQLITMRFMLINHTLPLINC